MARSQACAALGNGPGPSNNPCCPTRKSHSPLIRRTTQGQKRQSNTPHLQRKPGDENRKKDPAWGVGGLSVGAVSTHTSSDSTCSTWHSLPKVFPCRCELHQPSLTKATTAPPSTDRIASNLAREAVHRAGYTEIYTKYMHSRPLCAAPVDRTSAAGPRPDWIEHLRHSVPSLPGGPRALSAAPQL